MLHMFAPTYLVSDASASGLQFGVVEQVGAIVLIGVVSARLAKAFRVPMLVPLLITGLVLGPFGLGLVEPGSFGISLTGVAFVIIPLYLFAEGLSMDLSDVRSYGAVVVSLVTVGVVITALGVAAVAHFVLGMPLLVSLLLGAILGSTDPSAIIPLLESGRVSRKVSSIAKAESALNDPTSIVLFTVALSMLSGSGPVSAGSIVAEFGRLLLGGLLVGLLFGYTSVALVERFGLEEQLNYVTVITFIAAYTVSGYFETSNIVASVVAGMVMGGELNRIGVQPQVRRNLTYFWDNVKFIAEVLIFLLLGLYTTRDVFAPANLLGGLIVALAMVFLIRPAAVFGSALNRLSRAEKLFVSWMGARGAVPAALGGVTVGLASTVPALEPYATRIFAIVFFMVIFTIGLVAFTVTSVARRLGLEVEDRLEEYRSMRARQISLMAALRNLEEAHARGDVSDNVYSSLREEYQSKLTEIEAKMQEIEGQLRLNTEQLQILRRRRQLILTQINTLNEYRRANELSEKAYRELMDDLMRQLNEVEEKLSKLMVGEAEKTEAAKT